MRKQYFQITVTRSDRNGLYVLAFHTGDDRKAVKAGQSLNQSIALDQNAGARTAEMVDDWNNQIDVYRLEKA